MVSEDEELIAGATDPRLLVGVNHRFAARIGEADVAVLRNVSADAPFLKVPSMGTRGKRRARGEQDERQSCDNGFHFRSPSIV
jgi:hypothetical protein